MPPSRTLSANLQPEPGWAPPDLDVLFLCFTNRCGSNYLAHLLASTGAFNEAGEFFNAPVVLMHALPRGLRSLPAYFSALPALVFDRAAIDLELAMIAYDNAAFSLFFSVNGIVPVHITYEALLTDAGPAVGAVAATLGLAGLCPQRDKVAIYRQANAINAAWRATYLADPSFAMGTLPNADKLILFNDPAAYTRKALKHLLKIAAAPKKAAK